MPLSDRGGHNRLILPPVTGTVSISHSSEFRPGVRVLNNKQQILVLVTQAKTSAVQKTDGRDHELTVLLTLSYDPSETRRIFV